VRDSPLQEMCEGQAVSESGQNRPYAFAEEVTRVNGRVVTRYLGIMRMLEAGQSRNSPCGFEAGAVRIAEEVPPTGDVRPFCGA